MRQSRQFNPAIVLKYGQYTDQGFRFRKNIYDYTTSWWWNPQEILDHKIFYDVHLFRHDTFTVRRDYEIFGKFHFRLDTSELHHKRTEYDFSMLLGDIGGTAELLVKLASFLIGGFLSFNSSFEIIKDLYSDDKEILEILK